MTFLNPLKYLARWLLRHELQEFHLTLAQARANEQYWRREFENQLLLRTNDFIDFYKEKP